MLSNCGWNVLIRLEVFCPKQLHAHAAQITVTNNFLLFIKLMSATRSYGPDATEDDSRRLYKKGLSNCKEFVIDGAVYWAGGRLAGNPTSIKQSATATSSVAVTQSPFILRQHLIFGDATHQVVWKHCLTAAFAAFRIRPSRRASPSLPFEAALALLKGETGCGHEAPAFVRRQTIPVVGLNLGAAEIRRQCAVVVVKQLCKTFNLFQIHCHAYLTCACFCCPGIWVDRCGSL